MALLATAVGCCLFFGTTAQHPPSPPTPPRQSATQLAIYNAVAEQAAQQSAAATSELLSLFDGKEMRAALDVCCKSISAIPAAGPDGLLERLRREVRVAELVHNFERFDRLDSDLSLDSGPLFDYFPGLWELQYLDWVPSASSAHHGPEDVAEKGVFGFSPFSGSRSGQPFPATYLEAADRPVYIAWNILQADMGNPNFGSVCAVFETGYSRNMTVVAAIDTGIYEMACNTSYGSDGPGASPPHHHWAGNCSEHARAVGTLEHFDHLLLFNHYYWNASSLLGATMARLFGDTDEIRLAAADTQLTEAYVGPLIDSTLMEPEPQSFAR